MSRFERESISRKVQRTSVIYAVLAGLGFLIIGLQVFYRTTGFDLFNINYNLRQLFSESAKSNRDAESTLNTNSNRNADGPSGELVAASPSEAVMDILNNPVVLTPIRPAKEVSGPEEQEPAGDPFSIINLQSVLRSGDLYTSESAIFYSGNNRQKGILPPVKDVRHGHFSIGLSVIPGISYSRVSYTRPGAIEAAAAANSGNGYYQSEKTRNSMNKPVIKYSFGLDVNYRFSDRINVQTGLIYLNTGESVLVREIVDEAARKNHALPQNDPYFEGSPDFESPTDYNDENNVRIANNLSYLEVPLLLNVRIRNSNPLTSLELQGGLSVTRLQSVTALVYNYANDGYYLISGSDPAVFRKYGSHAIAGICYNKFITGNAQVFINPQARVGLTNSFVDGYAIGQCNLNLGVRLGMRINL